MRILIFIVATIAPFFVFAQDIQLRKKIDASVLKINSSGNKTMYFTTTGKATGNKTITFKYWFKYNGNQLEYVAREFGNKDSLVKQKFYMLASSLIFSTETITYYYGKDSVGWGGTYYFSKGKLTDFETLGHGKSEDEAWEPEAEVLQNYQKAKDAVVNYRKEKTASVRPTFKNISEVIQDKRPNIWVERKDSSASLALHFYLDFKKDTLAVSYSSECWLMYPYKRDENKIVVYWAYYIDSKYDFDIVKAIDKIDEKYIGKPFMILELANDTTLKATYPIPDLIKKINSSSNKRKFFPDKYVVVSQKLTRKKNAL